MRLILISLVILPLIAGCTQAEFAAANERLEQQMYGRHPGGPAGAGLDMFIAGQQIRALRGY